MKSCYHCGNRLPLGTEKFCPECGKILTGVLTSSDSGSTGTKISGTATNITETSGDVIGPATSGMANIIGKEVAYTVSGSVINIHVETISAEILKELKDMLKLEAKGSLSKRTYSINAELTDVKADEAKMTKEATEQILKDINNISREKGVRIEQIKVEDLQVSRSELQVKDLVSEGNEYYYKGDYWKAATYFDKAIEIDERYGTAWNNKGNSLSNLGAHEEAIAYYDKALEIDGQNTYSWNGKGIALYKLDKYKEAIECYDKALEINEKYGTEWINKSILRDVDLDYLNVDAWNGKGWALKELGKYNEAIVCYDKALEIEAEYVDLWNSKGLTLAKMKEYEKAIECYDRVLEIDDKYGSAWNNKGWSLNHLNKYTAAIWCYDKALEIDGQNTYSWNGKGIALYKLDKYKEAIECYDKALEINEKYGTEWINKSILRDVDLDYLNVDAWNGKGSALVKLGKHKEAKKCYKMAKQLG